jgi:hypothetical protein
MAYIKSPIEWLSNELLLVEIRGNFYKKRFSDNLWENK